MMINKFSKWIRWEKRNELNQNLGLPGVYCIAVSEIDISNKELDWNLSEIKYVGMTNSKTGLKGRLKQFDNTINGKLQHGGADRFLGNYLKLENFSSKLFVSVCTFECDVKSNKANDLIIMGNVAKFEYDCMAEYEKIHNALPEFNDKQKSLKYSKTKNENSYS